MNIRMAAIRALHGVRRSLGQPIPEDIMAKFLIQEKRIPEIQKSINNALASMFFEHRGRVVHKWVHYLDVYERHFATFRNTPVKMLEIGVFKGGSLEMWRKYFGDAATIFGIDVNPACAGYVSSPNQVRIGSQDDPVFLTGVVSEMGSPDIILDDGSHIARHQKKAFDVLFPLLKPGGLYVIEDLHTAYWPALYEGGHKRPGTAIELVKQMLDDMHAWYHNRPTTTPAKTEIGAIHMYNAVVVIEKVKNDPPGHVQIGQPASLPT